MHVGHVRNYSIGDAIARFNRMRGYNVLHPMGWDAFGLPAENYAIKTGVSPRQAINENTDRFKKQLIQMGFGYDWTREIDSTDPNYYKWTQWFFLLLHKRGLAYQQESLQWWCPVDKTVLANEQVENGRCWRCENEVEKKPLKQWFFKITDYADRLLEDLDDLDWSDAIKTMQKNWIGRSVGAEITFAIAPPDAHGSDEHKEGSSNGTNGTKEYREVSSVGSDTVITESDVRVSGSARKQDSASMSVRIFTTRADTLFGATFMVLAPEHPLVNKIATEVQKTEVESYVKQAQAKSDIERQDTAREKTGVFTGAYAINPVNNKKIPIWIADYVLYGYGTGAIMAVPAHDQRDFEFAQKFDLPINQVIMPCEPDAINPPRDELGEIKSREVVVVHIKDKSTGKFALLKWHGSLKGTITSVMGGIEKGQSFEDAAKAEALEEAGLPDIKITKKLRWLTGATYCASHKNVNRKAYAIAVIAEVENLDKQTKISDKEKKIHTLYWVDEDKVENELTPAHHKLMWQQLREETALSGEGEMINSGDYDGMDSAEARDKIVADLEKKKIGKEQKNYKIRDWLISRQRYWGAPIPMIHCKKCGTVPVPEDQLPVELPELDKFEPSGDGRSPLANIPEFINTNCPKCGGQAERETDTMDGFACSSWYFLRFADPHNNKNAFAKDKAEFWLPVDDYIGGAEHAVMHLLYARFWTKVMFDEGLISFKEPFTTLRNQGMILAPDGQKMSKSKGNTIEPDGLIEQGYGADSIRLMELFVGPYNQSANWSVEGMGGVFRFVQRVWTLAQEFMDAKPSDKSNKNLVVMAHKTIAKVSADLEDLSFNTAISALMEFTNELYKIKAKDNFASKEWKEAIDTLLQLLAPFAPHITEELWEQLGNKDSIHVSEWPVHDKKYLETDSVVIVIQVNGKVRANIEFPIDSDEKTVLELAVKDKKVSEHISGKTIKKTIYVPNKLLSIVI